MNVRTRLLVICLALIASQADASTAFQNDNMMLSGGFGVSFFNTFNNQYLGISPYIFDLYTNSTNHHKPSAFLSVKKSLALTSNYVERFHVGPAVYWQKSQYSGQVWELGLPLFYNYNYAFHNDLVNVMMESDVYGRPLFANILPYFTLGLGLGTAFAKYNDYALPGIPLNTQFQWSGAPLKAIYELGLGLQKPITEQWSLSLHYAYFGVSKLKANVSLYQPLTFDLNNQNVMVGLNYALS